MRINALIHHNKKRLPHAYVHNGNMFYRKKAEFFRSIVSQRQDNHVKINVEIKRLWKMVFPLWEARTMRMHEHHQVIISVNALCLSFSIFLTVQLNHAESSQMVDGQRRTKPRFHTPNHVNRALDQDMSPGVR